MATMFDDSGEYHEEERKSLSTGLSRQQV